MHIKLTLSLLLFSTFTCYSQQTEQVNQLIDQWHQAAANADASSYFDAIAEDGIYIGTDATERWDKASFKAFATPYFQRGTAWDFKPYDRQVIFSEDQKTAWFSELLHTWMGVCRGSGIVTQTTDGWKIRQYHLSVTVPNEIIQDFISLVENYEKKK